MWIQPIWLLGDQRCGLYDFEEISEACRMSANATDIELLNLQVRVDVCGQRKLEVGAGKGSSSLIRLYERGV